MPTYRELLTNGKSVGYDYMQEIYKLGDFYYLVNFDNPEFTPMISFFAFPSYEELSMYGEQVKYIIDGFSELIRYQGLTYSVKSGEIKLV